MRRYAAVALFALCVLGAGQAARALEGRARLVAEAEAALGEGRYVEALDALKKALVARPKDWTARLLSAEIYLLLGDGPAAEREARRARTFGGPPERVLPMLAKALLIEAKHVELLAEVRPDGLSAHAAATIAALRGQANLAMLRYAAAEAELEGALAREPANGEARLGLARLALARGRPGTASSHADAAVTIRPDDPDTWYVQGEARRQAGALAAAIESYGRAVELAPQHIPALIARAATRLELGRIEAAVADLDAVERVLPSETQARVLRAIAFARLGRADDAQQALRKASARIDQMDPEALERDPPSMLLAAAVRFASGDLERAHRLLRRYIALVPGNAGARKLQGEIQIVRKEYDQAVEALAPALAEQPDDARLHALMGEAELGRKSYRAAAAALAEASRLAPEDASVRARLALARLGTSDGKAAAELARAFARGGEDWRIGIALGLVQLHDGQAAAAAKTARALARRRPASPLPPNLEGIARLGEGREDAARQGFEAALGRDPSYLPALYNLAALDIDAGDLADARRRLLAIVQTVPGETRALMSLARIAEAEGLTEEALRWIAKAETAEPGAATWGLARVRLLMRYGRHEEARRAAEPLAAGHKRDGAVLEALAGAEAAAGARDKAVATYRRLTATVAASVAELVSVARAQERLADYDGAVFSLESARSIDPGNAGLRDAAIELEAERRAPREAEAYLAGLAAGPEKHLAVDLARGALLMREGKPAAAARVFARALEAVPNRRTAFRLHDALARAGRTAEAFAALERWSAAHPGDRIAGRFLAARLAAAGRAKEARAVLAGLARRHPKDAALANDLAWIAHAERDPAALGLAEAAHALAPDDPAALDTLGWILVERGSPEAGLKRLRAAAARAPGEPRIGYHLGVALARLGLRDEARRALAQALAAAAPFDERAAAARLAAQMAAR